MTGRFKSVRSVEVELPDPAHPEPFGAEFLIADGLDRPASETSDPKSRCPCVGCEEMKREHPDCACESGQNLGPWCVKCSERDRCDSSRVEPAPVAESVAELIETIRKDHDLEKILFKASLLKGQDDEAWAIGELIEHIFGKRAPGSEEKEGEKHEGTD